MTVESSLCVITDKDHILLLKKATGIGKDKWYPTGGKVRPDETPGTGVAREVYEETGLRVTNLRHHGKVVCYFGHDTPPRLGSSNILDERFQRQPEGEQRGSPQVVPPQRNTIR
jgi:8-oxo-dGTP pyrophosphatase MutT (NUDIX family)